MEDVNICSYCIIGSCCNGKVPWCKAKCHSFKDCNYCCEPKECAIKGCYNKAMNVSGKEMKITATGLIVPVHYMTYEDLKKAAIERLNKLGETGLYKDPFTITKEWHDERDKKKMNTNLIYSFPLRKCSRTIWTSKNNRQQRIQDMPVPHLKNVYAKLLFSAWIHCENQDTINAITKLTFPGRYSLSWDKNIARMHRSLGFLNEMCPAWGAIVARLHGLKLCKHDGAPISYSVNAQDHLVVRFEKPTAREELLYGDWNVGTSKSSGPRLSDTVEAILGDKVKMTNGKVVTDGAGKQYLLFPIE